MSALREARSGGRRLSSQHRLRRSSLGALAGLALLLALAFSQCGGAHAAARAVRKLGLYNATKCGTGFFDVSDSLNVRPLVVKWSELDQCLYVATLNVLYKVDGRTCARTRIAGGGGTGVSSSDYTSSIPALNYAFNRISDFTQVGRLIFIGDYSDNLVLRLDLDAGTIKKVAGKGPGNSDQCGPNCSPYLCEYTPASQADFHIGGPTALTYSPSVNRMFWNFDRCGGQNVIHSVYLNNTWVTGYSMPALEASEEESSIVADPESDWVYFCSRDGSSLYRFDARTEKRYADSNNNLIDFTSGRPDGKAHCKAATILSNPQLGLWYLFVIYEWSVIRQFDRNGVYMRDVPLPPQFTGSNYLLNENMQVASLDGILYVGIYDSANPRTFGDVWAIRVAPQSSYVKVLTGGSIQVTNGGSLMVGN